MLPSLCHIFTEFLLIFLQDALRGNCSKATLSTQYSRRSKVGLHYNTIPKPGSRALLSMKMPSLNSSIEKVQSPLCSPNLKNKCHLLRKAFFEHCPPSRIDHIIPPLNTHLALVLLYYNTTIIVFKTRIMDLFCAFLLKRECK